MWSQEQREDAIKKAVEETRASADPGVPYAAVSLEEANLATSVEHATRDLESMHSSMAITIPPTWLEELLSVAGTLIGKGGYGEVHRLTVAAGTSLQQQLVCKIPAIPPMADRKGPEEHDWKFSMAALCMEARVGCALRHPNIVRFLGTVYRPPGNLHFLPPGDAAGNAFSVLQQRRPQPCAAWHCPA